MRAIVLPLAWTWPVLQWSKLGTREAMLATGPLFFSAPHPVARQLTASWLAGVGLSLLAGGAVALRLLISGNNEAVLAWLVGAMFAPALALALGVWSRSTRFFEVLYMCTCYAVIQSAVPLDFMGATDAAIERGLPAVYAVVTAALLALAALGRARSLRN